MNISIKSLDKSQVHIIVEVPVETVTSFRKRAIAMLSSEVKIPGFRAGKATEDVIINYVGEKAIIDQTVDLVIQSTYADVVKEKNIRVVARPGKVELISYEPFKYEVVVAVYPEVKLKNYKKIKIPKEEVSVSKAEVQEIINDMQKRHASYTPVEREAIKTDRVMIDFQGKDENGVVLDGTSSKNHPLILGEGRFIPGFEEQVLGMKKGGKKVFDIVFPSDYRASHLKGKKVTFDVEVHDIHQVSLPSVDEDFIKKIKGKSMTPIEFTEEVTQEIKQYKEQENERKRENILMEKLLTVAEVDLPDALVSEELDYMIEDYKKRIEDQGLDFVSFLQRSNTTEENLREKWKKDAHDRVAVRIILRAVIEKEEPTVSEQEIQEELDHLQEHLSQEERQKHQATYREGSREREELISRLQVRKVVSLFLR